MQFGAKIQMMRQKVMGQMMGQMVGRMRRLQVRPHQVVHVSLVLLIVAPHLRVIPIQWDTLELILTLPDEVHQQRRVDIVRIQCEEHFKQIQSEWGFKSPAQFQIIIIKLKDTNKTKDGEMRKNRDQCQAG